MLSNRQIVYVYCLIAAILCSASALFPAVCVDNATLPGATCCPIPPGFIEPCGGKERGRCVPLPKVDDLRNVPEDFLDDDRLNWPTRFFEYACECAGNFSGYMCHECWYGNTGPDCNQPIKAVRKDIRSLTLEERQNFVSLLQKSKEVQSEYMVLNTSQDADPTVKPHFLNVSVYRYLSYLHYYASRKTIFKNDSMCDDPKLYWLDPAHAGPAFPVWHRLYSLKWERALRSLSKDKSFALPYWNWIDGGKECEVCTDELLGAPNFSDPDGRLSSKSVFSTWRVICDPPIHGCQRCDPHVDNGPLIRRPGADPGFPDLPTTDDVNYALSLIYYDLEPFTDHSPNTAFRNVLEGFANSQGPTISNGKIHNGVHRYLNGTMCQLNTASMDPIFIVHHTFVDKLFEIWIRKNRANARGLPVVGALPGHCRASYLTPFFPIEPAFQFFQRSDELGYEYDNLAINPKGGNRLTGGEIAGISVVALALFLAVAICYRYRKRIMCKSRYNAL